MLQTYKVICHDILNIHNLAKFIVLDYWCKSSKEYSILFPSKYKAFFDKLPAFKGDVVRIYEKSSKLSLNEKKIIKISFINQNDIEKLCNSESKLFNMHTYLPDIVNEEMKPFFIKLYEEYSDRKTLRDIFGSKKDYYDELYDENDFTDCPCCGMSYIESSDSEKREDFDHYLPKFEFIFASINYRNLSPLCKKCNSTFKGETNPIEKRRKAFYPYSNTDNEIKVEIIADKDITTITDIILSGKKQEQINTWNSVFSIKKRYSSRENQLKKNVIKDIKLYMRENNVDFLKACTFFIKLYSRDKYSESKLIKIALIYKYSETKHIVQQMNNKN